MFGVDLSCNDWKANLIFLLTVVGIVTIMIGFVYRYIKGGNDCLYIIGAGALIAIITMTINLTRKC